LKFCPNNNKQTTLVIIPSTLTKEKRQKEVALLAPVELVSPCILVGEENVTTILSLHHEKKKKRKWKMF